jgi:hypothetical protein
MSFLVSLLGLVGWAIWGYTVLFVEPEAPFGSVAFFAGLMMALTCTLARLLESPGYEDVDGVRVSPKPALGHAAALSIMFLFALWLQSLRMLTTLNGALLALTVAMIELGFRLTERRGPRVRRRSGHSALSNGGRAGEPQI